MATTAQQHTRTTSYSIRMDAAHHKDQNNINTSPPHHGKSSIKVGVADCTHNLPDYMYRVLDQVDDHQEHRDHQPCHSCDEVGLSSHSARLCYENSNFGCQFIELHQTATVLLANARRSRSRKQAKQAADSAAQQDEQHEQLQVPSARKVVKRC